MKGNDTAGDVSDANGDPDLPVRNIMPRHLRYQPPRVDESPFSSDSEIYASGGVPLNRSDNMSFSSTQHQTRTFAELAAEQGIREWNNGVFDDRWLLHPEEMWKTDARRKSVLTIPPDRPSINSNTPRVTIPVTRSTEALQELAAKQEQIDALNRELADLRHRFRGASLSSEPSFPHNGGGRRNAATSTNWTDALPERQSE